MSPPKTKISQEVKDILGTLRIAMVDYQQALPAYMEGMKMKYPPRPPRDLDTSERRTRESLLRLAQKLDAERDEDASWRRHRDQELKVKAEVIAKREEIPNVYRGLLREMEGANERLRNTKKQIGVNEKQVGDLRSNMDDMDCWLRSGEPATKEMLLSIGTVKYACSSSKARVISGTRSPSVRSNCSASSRSSASSRFSTSPAASVSGVVEPASKTRGGGATPVAAAAPVFKTRRPVKRQARAPLRRAEYCPVGNEVSFRKRVIATDRVPAHACVRTNKTAVNTCGKPRTPSPDGSGSESARQRSSSSRAGKPNAAESRGSGGNARTADETSRKLPKAGSSAAATKVEAANAARKRPTPTAGAGAGASRRTSPPPNKAGARPKRPTSASSETKKRPPWRPMA